MGPDLDPPPNEFPRAKSKHSAHLGGGPAWVLIHNKGDPPPQDCPLVGIEIAGWQPPASQRVKYLRVSSMSHENSGSGFPPGWYRTPRPRRRQKSPKTHW